MPGFNREKMVPKNTLRNHKTKDLIFTPRTIKNFVTAFKAQAEYSEPRGKGTYEIIDARVLVRNPVDRVIVTPSRKMNIAFGFAEFYSMLYGIDDINFFTPFIKDYSRFSTDGVTLDGAYGTRLNLAIGDTVFDIVGKKSQILGVIEKLRADKNSRQAVASIYNSEDIFGGGGLNTPCSLTMQYLIRDEKLIAITNMRSNDIYRGLTYDAFFFTLMQEFIARQLGCELGIYSHHAGSLHYYVEDEPQIKLLENDQKSRWPFLMNEMPYLDGSDIEKIYELLIKVVLERDHGYFLKKLERPSSWSSYHAWEWALNSIGVMGAFINRKSDSDCLIYYTRLTDVTIKHVLRHYAKPKGIVKYRQTIGGA